MIGQESRMSYIGGSDMQMVYGNYFTATFKNWWAAKQTGIKSLNLKGEAIWAGNIIEHYILDAIGIPMECRGVKKTKEGTVAGVNTDALVMNPDGTDGVVIEAKTMQTVKTLGLIHGNLITIGYRRQVYHAMWVCGVSTAEIHLLGLKEDDYKNPFQVNPKDRLIKITLKLEDFDVVEHEHRIYYLTECMHSMEQPTNYGLELFKMHRI